MAVKYPYVPSAGPLVKAFTQFRKSLPATVAAQTLKKLGIAPNNETYVINAFRFLGLVESDGSPSIAGKKLFTQHSDEAFAQTLTPIVEDAYKPLFDVYGDGAWALPKPALITFFRNDDQSTEIVGTRQAATFGALAGLAGKAAQAPTNNSGTSPTKKVKKQSAPSSKGTLGRDAILGAGPAAVSSGNLKPRVGLAVRVELVLPATTDKEVYDTIFRSIRENFIDAEQD